MVTPDPVLKYQKCNKDNVIPMRMRPVVAVMGDKRLSSNAKVLYLMLDTDEIGNYRSDLGRSSVVTVGQSVLAGHMGRSLAATSRAIKQLVQAGYLRVEKRRGDQPATYYLVNPKKPMTAEDLRDYREATR